MTTPQTAQPSGLANDVNDVIVSPDGSDVALVVFKDIRSVQKALQLDGTNMRDNVITVCVDTFQGGWLQIR